MGVGGVKVLAEAEAMPTIEPVEPGVEPAFRTAYIDHVNDISGVFTRQQSGSGCLAGAESGLDPIRGSVATEPPRPRCELPDMAVVGTGVTGTQPGSVILNEHELHPSPTERADNAQVHRPVGPPGSVTQA